MKIRGEFRNKAGDLVEVVINVAGSTGADMEIGDGLSGLWFAADGAVETASDVSDTFDHVLSQTATIRLLADKYVAELFQSSTTGAAVNVYREGVCLFAGYIEPRTYSQEFNSVLDELDVNCVDCLSALERLTYRGAGKNDEEYAGASASAVERSLAEILGACFKRLTDGLALKDGQAVRFLYDGSRGLDASAEADRYEIFRKLTLSDMLFLDSGADSVWSCKEVVEEVMRYLNLRILQNGLDFYIYDFASVRDGNEVYWGVMTADGLASSIETMGRRGATEITTSLAADTGTRLSIGSTYSRLSAKCDVRTVEELVADPLDTDSLTSPYSRRQIYCTEYVSDDETAFYVATKRDTPLAYDEKVVARHWFIRVMENGKWKFPYTGSGANKGKDLVGLYCRRGKAQYLLPRALSEMAGAAILKIARVATDYDSGDDSTARAAALEGEEACLVVSVNGSGDDSEAGADAMAAKLKGAYPVAVYSSGSATLTPSVEEATNYVVVSGSVELVPLQEQTGAFHSIRGTRRGAKFGDKVARRDGKRYYTRRYWEQEDELATTYTDKEVSEDAKTDEGLVFAGDDCPQEYKYKYSGKWDTADKYSKVGVLACMLVVGKKCAVEEETPRGVDNVRSFGGGGDSEKSRIVWKDYKTLEECLAAHPDDSTAGEDEYFGQSFTIGFNPKIGDSLLGTEFEIQNNITWDMDVDAKGTAIPVRQADGLSGDVELRVLGPVNVLWDETTRRHPTFFRHTKWKTTSVALMQHVANIVVRNFSVKVYGDNAHAADDGSDIVYTSATDRGFNAVKTDIEFKIHSALTTEEAVELGTSSLPALSTPTIAASGRPLTEVYDWVSGALAKPERIYIDAAWREWHKPRIILEQNIVDTAGRPYSPFELYKHPAIAGKTFFAQSAGRDLMAGTANVEMKETEADGEE